MSRDFGKAFTWGCGVTLGVVSLLAFLIVGLPLLMAGGCLAGLGGLGSAIEKEREAAERSATHEQAQHPERVALRRPVQESEPMLPRIVRDSETESPPVADAPAETPETKPAFIMYEGMFLSSLEEELGPGRRTRRLGDAASYVWETAGGTLDATFEDDELVDWTVGGVERGNISSAKLQPVPERQETAQEEKPVANMADGKCSLAEFNRIDYGMSYAQVVQIIGGEGELTSANRIQGVAGVMESIETKLYQWEGVGGFGANMLVMFQNDKVIQKSQFGLK
jgi:hypothetical protein